MEAISIVILSVKFAKQCGTETHLYNTSSGALEGRLPDLGFRYIGMLTNIISPTSCLSDYMGLCDLKPRSY